MPRRLSMFIGLAALLLTSCSGGNVTYKISFNTERAEEQSALLLASLRVIERRLSRMGDQLLEQDIKAKDGEHFIILRIRERTAQETLTGELTSPFTLHVMQQSPEATADIVVEGHGGFAKTPVTEKHLQWIEARANGKQGMIILDFTEEGRAEMQKVFRANRKKAIGLFVRGKLVSKLVVETDTVTDDIVIQNIPSLEIAKIFADDVNVGLHVTFVPVP